MKAKLKIDSQQIKGFFIQHGEKFVMVAAVAILVLFGLSALKRETLPENLQSASISSRAGTATDNVVNKSDPPAQLVPQLNFVDDVSVWRQDVPQRALTISNSLSVPAFPNLPKRSEPTLFPLLEVHVQPFRGALILNAAAAPAAGLAPAPNPLIAPPVNPKAAPPKAGKPAAGANPLAPGLLPGAVNVVAGPQPIPAGVNLPGPQSTGYGEARYGMLVTGLLPDEKQRAEFEERFKNARRAAAEGAVPGGRDGRDAGASRDIDTPHYVWCRLERTDTTDGSVKLMDFGDLDQVRADWADKTNPKKHDYIAQAKISPAFYNQAIADVAKWGTLVPEIANPDYIAASWITWPLPPIALHDWGLDGVHPKVPLAAAAAAAANGGAGNAVPGNGGNNPAAPGFDDKGVADPAGRGAILPRVAAPQGDPNAVPENTAPYRMFRFVDFDVVPGHAYQYRVQILLRNPNFGLDLALLVKPDANAPLYRETPWSDKSALAALPPDSRFIAGEIVRRKRVEPRVKNLGVLQWDHKSALELLLQRKEVELGEVLNYVGKEATLKDVMDGVTRTVHDVETEFLTQAALIDLRGNEEKLPGGDNLLDTSEVLLLTNVDDLAHPEQTRLVVVNQAIDQAAVEQWDQTHKVPAGLANSTGSPGGLLGPLGGPPATAPKTPVPAPRPTPRRPTR